MSAQQKLLRIYTDEAAFFGDRKVYEVVVARARESRLAVATVLQALMGFGRSAHLHGRHVLDDDRSVVIEIVDDEAALCRFVETLSDISDLGLITLEAVEVLRGAPRAGLEPA